MTQRCMQIHLPDDAGEHLDELLKEHERLGTWRDALHADRILVQVLISADETEALMDHLDQQFGSRDGFHVVLTPVEAVLPRPCVEETSESPNGNDLREEVEEAVENPGRVSREELYSDITETLESHRIYIATTLLSAIVAAVGLIGDNVTAIIGAMVIAPLLGPNMAMTLAATLGDLSLLRRAFVRNLLGFALALGSSILIGFFVTVSTSGEEIRTRTQVSLADLVLALAAGSAGTFAFTRGLSNAVVGVMVAVALMPPLVACGLLLGAGEFAMSFGALLLALANVLCINLAGVATFLAQGVRPRKWYEQEQAEAATRWAIIIGGSLLLALAGILTLTQVR